MAEPVPSIIPSNDEDLLSADAQLTAAELSLVDNPFSPGAEGPSEPPVPFGRSWAWDWERGRFHRSSTRVFSRFTLFPSDSLLPSGHLLPGRRSVSTTAGSPEEVRGTDALREWINAALATAQGGCPIFSDDFGIEDPDDWIGVADPTDALATFEPRAKEALRQHDRIEDLDIVAPNFDPSTGIITIENLNVITDQEDAVPLLEFEIKPGL